jgi:hypothetical protein
VTNTRRIYQETDARLILYQETDARLILYQETDTVQETILILYRRQVLNQKTDNIPED